MKNLVKKIQNNVSLQSLWKRNSKVIVGVSGGPDSVCLLDVLVKIKEKSEMDLHVVHVNYGLRGKDSEKDQELVQELAQKNELGLSVLKVEKLKKINEEKLRNIRYDFFEKVRMELNFDLIAVAHNQDDQVETFFLHLLRGTGLSGLSGMKFKNEKIVRPLLDVSKKDILKYLRENKLKYRVDKTNKEDVFLRNKIRNKLIPYLEKDFNLNIRKTIFDATIVAGEDVSFISDFSKNFFSKNRKIKVNEIQKFHPAIQKRVILEKIKEVKGNLKNIESAHIEEILKIVRSKKGKNQNFSFQGLKIERKGDKLDLLKINIKQ